MPMGRSSSAIKALGWCFLHRRGSLFVLGCVCHSVVETTLLRTLLGLVPATERIVLVEDAAELRPAHPHVVALQARTANVEGVGAVGLPDLVRQALRMRPDRLVVGECRGAEVVDLLGALNTGHEGGAGTLHANAPGRRPGPPRGTRPAGRAAARRTARAGSGRAPGDPPGAPHPA